MLVSGMGYRVSFHGPSGAVQGQDEFEAEDDASAALLAEVLFDSCADICSAFRLWHGEAPVELRRGGAARPAESQIQVTSRTQESLIRSEEAIRNSQWTIARSQRLLERLRLLENDARLGRPSRLRRGPNGTGWQVLADGAKPASVISIPPEVLAIARSMIAQHGADAAMIAEKAAANVRMLDMQRMVRHWEGVAAAIRAIAAASPAPDRE